MRPLFEITADLLHLNAILDDCEGDLSRASEMEQTLTAWMDALGAEESDKLDGYIALVKHLDMESAAASAEAEQWQAKARSRKNRAGYLKARLKQHLELTGRRKVETAKGQTVAIQNNGGKAPVECDSTALPGDYPEFARVVMTWDCDKITTALEAGTELPFAKLGERGTHLRIRT